MKVTTTDADGFVTVSGEHSPLVLLVPRETLEKLIKGIHEVRCDDNGFLRCCSSWSHKDCPTGCELEDSLMILQRLLDDPQ